MALHVTADLIAVLARQEYIGQYNIGIYVVR
jgi:hypothetical protein